MQRTLRVMIVEDEFIIADEIAGIVSDNGHEVLGPYASVEAAMVGLSKESVPDMAILDANLRGKSSVPLADKLRELGVPLCVCTGYRSEDLRSMFGDVSILQKPVNARALTSLIQQTMAGGS